MGLRQLACATFVLIIFINCITISTSAKEGCRIFADKTIPPHAKKTLKQIQFNHGHAPSWYLQKEKPFENRERILPVNTADRQIITYTEYDVNNAKPRDAERIVWGSDGKAYYSPDHYCEFWEMGYHASGVTTLKPITFLIIVMCSLVGAVTFNMYNFLC